MSLKQVKQIKNVNWSTAGSVVVGMALFGLVVYAIRRAPSNAITDPLKRGTEIAANG